MTRKIFLYFLPLMALSLSVSCGTGGGDSHCCGECDTIALRYADNLTMVDCGGYIKADFRNPWDTTRTLQTFILVPRDSALPASLPGGTVVRVPLERSVVYTSVHCSLVEELGAVDAIVGVCDAQYLRDSVVKHRHDAGTVADCGTSMAPDIESILMLAPDAILLSAYENSADHNKVAQTGVPVIDCIDYMESSPLGRAEWMRFFGRLYGKGAEADSLFAETERAYLDVKERVAAAGGRPSVLSEMIYSGNWDVPGAWSTVGRLIDDAGGSNPFAPYRRGGSVRLAPEEVLYTAGDADIWMVKYYQDSPMTLSQLAADNPLYTRFSAYAAGNVYGCNTMETPYFEDSAFHPHWILAEYARILHPELDIDCGGRRYYRKLER